MTISAVEVSLKQDSTASTQQIREAVFSLLEAKTTVYKTGRYNIDAYWYFNRSMKQRTLDSPFVYTLQARVTSQGIHSYPNM